MKDKYLENFDADMINNNTLEVKVSNTIQHIEYNLLNKVDSLTQKLKEHPIYQTKHLLPEGLLTHPEDDLIKEYLVLEYNLKVAEKHYENWKIIKHYSNKSYEEYVQKKNTKDTKQTPYEELLQCFMKELNTDKLYLTPSLENNVTWILENVPTTKTDITQAFKIRRTNYRCRHTFFIKEKGFFVAVASMFGLSNHVATTKYGQYTERLQVSGTHKLLTPLDEVHNFLNALLEDERRLDTTNPSKLLRIALDCHDIKNFSIKDLV